MIIVNVNLRDHIAQAKHNYHWMLKNLLLITCNNFIMILLQIVDAEWNILYDKLKKIHEVRERVVLLLLLLF